MKKQQEKLNLETGELTPAPKLNEVITVITHRKGVNGYNPSPIRIQQDFSNCPTMAEQHTAHLTDINYLMERYKPDELAAYIAARSQYRREIIGHDFSQEPSLQDAKGIVYRSKKEFDALPEDVRIHFKNHVEFLKFIDNPANKDKMLKLGILTPRQVENLIIPEPNQQNLKQNETQTQNQNESKNKNS